CRLLGRAPEEQPAHSGQLLTGPTEERRWHLVRGGLRLELGDDVHMGTRFLPSDVCLLAEHGAVDHSHYRGHWDIPYAPRRDLEVRLGWRADPVFRPLTRVHGQLIWWPSRAYGHDVFRIDPYWWAHNPW